MRKGGGEDGGKGVGGKMGGRCGGGVIRAFGKGGGRGLQLGTR